ncbi:MAG: MBL fold metallo-hydrolase [Anaerolineales bacterium]|nr:MBL fold metallo-hydrolase [Anaerolineales bacterium]
MTHTQLILLGTGNPNPDPRHQGCALLLLVDDTPFVFDFGAGVVRQAAALTTEYGGPLAQLKIRKLKTAFLTHLHSDHTVGYPDLILTPWVMGRDNPLEVYGPVGTAMLTGHILHGYWEDIRYRVEGLERGNNQGWQVNVYEFDDGVIYETDLLKVEAFRVHHGTMPNVYGFRCTTPDKVVVLSGDTTPCENLITFGQGADILVHEVYSQKGFARKDPHWQAYHASHHTSTSELAEIASQLRPGLLVLNHVLFWGATEQEILEEIAEGFDGQVVVGADLQVFS